MSMPPPWDRAAPATGRRRSPARISLGIAAFLGITLALPACRHDPGAAIQLEPTSRPTPTSIPAAATAPAPLPVGTVRRGATSRRPIAGTPSSRAAGRATGSTARTAPPVVIVTGATPSGRQSNGPQHASTASAAISVTPPGP